MAVEENPKYAEWRVALEEYIDACKASKNGEAAHYDVQQARKQLDKIISELD